MVLSICDTAHQKPHYNAIAMGVS